MSAIVPKRVDQHSRAGAMFAGWSRRRYNSATGQARRSATQCVLGESLRKSATAETA